MLNEILRLSMISFCSASLISSISSCVAPEHDVETALAGITTEQLIEEVKILSTDEFQGRAPSSEGEEKTVNFLRDEFEKLGARPEDRRRP